VTTMAIKVKLIGVLKGLAGRPEIRITPNKRALTVSDAISELCRKIPAEDFERAIIDPISKTIGPNVIVLVNEKDISVLRGLDTVIGSNDAITLVPVSHGG